MYDKLLKRQQSLFASGRTREIKLRVHYLQKLQRWIKDNTDEIMAALNKDLNKPPFEAMATEIGVALDELRYALKHIRGWARPRYTTTGIKNFPSFGRILPEPYGCVLIISPWNYPFMLTVSPLISAIAAGNCAIVKPSEIAPATSALISKMCAEVFHPAHIMAVEGGKETSQALLALDFDKIFYTGGTEVGRKVLEAAAKNLTPVTLELGGKSPCIVDQTANVQLAAKRIVWGKLLNAGQTCVAPDYILAHESVKDELIAEIIKAITKQYGSDPANNPQYPKIINERHFTRINDLIHNKAIVHNKDLICNDDLAYSEDLSCSDDLSRNENIVFGGNSNPATQQIEPTIIINPPASSPIMNEEIFGPVLPIITFSAPSDAVIYARAKPKPLALYIFSSCKSAQEYYLNNIPSGGGCINDTVVHLSSPRLPFGGVGQSGMGSCHGKAGFDAFTHYRSVLHKSNLLDIPLRYPPYSSWALKLIKRL